MKRLFLVLALLTSLGADADAPQAWGDCDTDTDCFEKHGFDGY